MSGAAGLLPFTVTPSGVRVLLALPEQGLFKQATAGEMEKLAGGIDLGGFSQALSQMGAGGGS